MQKAGTESVIGRRWIMQRIGAMLDTTGEVEIRIITGNVSSETAEKNNEL